jgi:hypothetical protein
MVPLDREEQHGFVAGAQLTDQVPSIALPASAVCRCRSQAADGSATGARRESVLESGANAQAQAKKFGRTTGLDETAQFLNVLVGAMSMVGPRPLTEHDVRRLGWSDARFDARFAVPPGITGLAQLLGGVSARHSLRLDQLYASCRSPGLDLLLIGLSAVANLIGKRRLETAWRGARRARRQLRRRLSALSKLQRSF